MSRNRRNKRSIKNITDVIGLKAFLIIVTILIIVILVCGGIIFYRNDQDKKMLAKQREQLDKDLETIFAKTTQNIEDANNAKRNIAIHLSAVGDILADNAIIEDGYQKNTKSYDFSSMFKNVKSLVDKSDITLGTMETNFTNNSYSGYGQRNCPIEFAKNIKDAGINLLSISTNHTLDFGIEGIKQTKQRLQELGCDTVGDRLEKNNVTIKNVKNAKIAFLSYTYGVENQSSKSNKELECANIFNKENAKKDLEYAKKNAEYIIVIMHWGDAYATEPSKEQRDIADFLVKNGVNIILGNHPAVIQPMEIRKNKDGEDVLIAYSLGNYISAISNEISKVELVLNIELIKQAKDDKIVLSKVDYTPIYVLDNGEKAQNRYELIDMKGTAKAYANGNKEVTNKKTYKKLLEGLELLEKVIGIKQQ